MNIPLLYCSRVESSRVSARKNIKNVHLTSEMTSLPKAKGEEGSVAASESIIAQLDLSPAF